MQDKSSGDAAKTTTLRVLPLRALAAPAQPQLSSPLGAAAHTLLALTSARPPSLATAAQPQLHSSSETSVASDIKQIKMTESPKKTFSVSLLLGYGTANGKGSAGFTTADAERETKNGRKKKKKKIH